MKTLQELAQDLHKSRRETEATGRLGWVYVEDEKLEQLVAAILTSGTPNETSVHEQGAASDVTSEGRTNLGNGTPSPATSGTQGETPQRFLDAYAEFIATRGVHYGEHVFGAGTCHKCDESYVRAEAKMDALFRELSEPVAPSVPAQEPPAESIWPACPWCSTELVKFVKGSGRCPNCGACVFPPSRPLHCAMEYASTLAASASPVPEAASAQKDKR